MIVQAFNSQQIAALAMHQQLKMHVRRFQKFLRDWSTKTVTGWEKPVSRERRFQRFLGAY